MSSTVQNVLVVDDDATVRDLIARMLSREGYNVQCASNGEEALAIACQLVGQLALVITDLQMPQMGGTELAAYLTRLTPAPRLLFISGSPATVGEELPGPLLPKPFALDALAASVHRMLDASASRGH